MWPDSFSEIFTARHSAPNENKTLAQQSTLYRMYRKNKKAIVSEGILIDVCRPRKGQYKVIEELLSYLISEKVFIWITVIVCFTTLDLFLKTGLSRAQ